jgi:hypothetical protein
VGRWGVNSVQELASGAQYLGWEGYVKFLQSPEILAIVVPILSGLRFFASPVALITPSDYKGMIITKTWPNGLLLEAMKGLRGETRAVAGFGPTEVSKCLFAIAFSMAQIYRLGNVSVRVSSHGIFLDSGLEPVIAGFVGLWRDPGMTFRAPPLDALFCLPPPWDQVQEDSAREAVYSFGMTLFRLFGGNHTFQGRNSSRHFLLWIDSGKRFDRPEGITDGYWDLIQACWHKDASARPTFQTIVDRLMGSVDLVFPGTDVEQYAAYCSRVSAESIDIGLVARIREAIEIYKFLNDE